MRRIHAFEFGDLSWYPNNLRRYATDYLQFASNSLDIYQCVIPIIEKGIKSSENSTIVDIASGGGGGLQKIAGYLKKNTWSLKIFLSDYFPNMDAFKRTKLQQPEVFEYVEEPVN